MTHVDVDFFVFWAKGPMDVRHHVLCPVLIKLSRKDLQNLLSATGDSLEKGKFPEDRTTIA